MAARHPFTTQAILYIMLDYTEEKKTDLQVIYKALESTVVLGGGVVGGTRLPGVGVGVLGDPYMRVLRLSPVRGNLPALLAALPRLLDDVTPSPRGTDVSALVCEALDAVVAEAASCPQASQHPLQMVVVTWGPVHVLTEAFSLVLTLEHARFLTAVHVAGVESLDGGAQVGSDDPPAGDAAGGVWVTGATYTPDPYTFTALFKSWLLEMKGREPHVHLILPPSSTSSSKEPLTLLLDMQEILMEPLSLPSAVSSRLTLHTNLYRTVSTTQGSSLGVARLEVLKRVRCDSVAPAVFGAAHYLLPTGATGLSFTTIWENRQQVAALSQRLWERDEGLLARAAAPPQTLSPLVVVLAAHQCSALSLVHIAPAELMLAERDSSAMQQPPPDKMVREVEEHLQGLEVSDLLLEDQSTCLTAALAQHFTKGAPVRGGSSGGGVGGRQQQQGSGSSSASGPPRRPLPQHPAFLPASTRASSRGGLGRRALRAHMMYRRGT